MSSLNNYVDVVITRETRTPSQAGFDRACILGYHTLYSDRMRLYADTDELLEEGFDENSEIYRAAKRMLAQNPRVTDFYVGREANREKQLMKVAPVEDALKANYPYSVTLNGIDFTYTTDASPTVAEVVDGLVAALQPAAWAPTTAYTEGEYVANDTPTRWYRCVVGGTSAGSGGPTGTGAGIADNTATWDFVCAEQPTATTDSGTYLSIESATVADTFTLKSGSLKLLDISNVTPDGDPGVVDDLAECRDEADDWYALIPTCLGKAPLQALQDEIETQVKMLWIATQDDAVRDATSEDDIAWEAKDKAYERSPIMYHQNPSEEQEGAGMAGVMLPFTPGSITMMFKTITGASSTPLTPSMEAAIKDKNCNMYVEAGGSNQIQYGVVPSGEYVDIIMGIDFITARLREQVLGTLQTPGKVSYTDQGVASIEATVRSVLQIYGVNTGFFAAEPPFTVTVPKVADVPNADKANRYLPDVRFEAPIAGAVHKVGIRGRLVL